MEPYTYKGWTIFEPKWFATHDCGTKGRVNWIIMTSKRHYYCTGCGKEAPQDVKDHLNAVTALILRTGLDRDAKP